MTSEKILGWARGAVFGSLLSMRVATTPSPQHRVIQSKYGKPYHAKTYEIFMADCAKTFAHHAGAYPRGGLPLFAYVEIIGARPKRSSLLAPKGDVDNYVKGVMDGATQANLWSDDTRVHTLIVQKRWSNPGEEPGVIMHVGELRE